MNNHNDHHHTHHHDDTQADLTFEQRMLRMLDHWIKHNESHALTYKDWAAKARQNKLLEVEKLLNDVAESTLKVNSQFKDAKKLIGKR
jgi:hypothetical protein